MRNLYRYMTAQEEALRAQLAALDSDSDSDED
jgi:hypothetical protein